jgi:glucosamine--fructose-6-phosphate aminotransferase (isomerizing)
MMHSRWATNGIVSINNAHPHIDHNNKITIVHNGIIDNYNELKNELMNDHSVIFKTETDTEVICNLLSVYYDYYKDYE